MDSLQGQLLVSSPALLDPQFRRTVVLIAHHDDEGAMGLVLTRPSDVAATEAVPSLGLVPGADGAVYVGGPDKVGVVDAVASLWFALALGQGKGRRLAFKTLMP